MKKHTKPIPREGYIACAVREFYPDLRNVKHNDPSLQAAVKLGKHCHEQLLKVKASVKSMLDHQSQNTINQWQGEEQPYLL